MGVSCALPRIGRSRRVRARARWWRWGLAVGRGGLRLLATCVGGAAARAALGGCGEGGLWVVLVRVRGVARARGFLTGAALVGGWGPLASALASAAVGAGVVSCRLLRGRLSFAAYRYALVTLAYEGVGEVVGASVGGAVGTALGLLPGALRGPHAPDRVQARREKELAATPALRMRDSRGGFVKLSRGGIDPAGLSSSSLDSAEEEEEEATRTDEPANRASTIDGEGGAEDSGQVLRPRPNAVSPPGDLSEAKEGEQANPIAGGFPFGMHASSRIAFAGKLEDFGEVWDWEDVSKRIDTCDENELVFVFLVKQ